MDDYELMMTTLTTEVVATGPHSLVLLNTISHEQCPNRIFIIALSKEETLPTSLLQNTMTNS